jgi:hypothetical protein
LAAVPPQSASYLFHFIYKRYGIYRNAYTDHPYTHPNVGASLLLTPPLQGCGLAFWPQLGHLSAIDSATF